MRGISKRNLGSNRRKVAVTYFTWGGGKNYDKAVDASKTVQHEKGWFGFQPGNKQGIRMDSSNKIMKSTPVSPGRSR